ncbi:hypothetical protein ABZ682_15335 [Streptomyces griseoviridis]|uniref:hypothetical protein n=1 Tax=Streptomyces griseoviridis TaxID=45398 RepID=UPI0033D6AAE0
MTDWPALRDLLTRGPGSGVTGVHTSVQPRRDDGRGWPPASPVRVVTRFVHRPPHDWFLDHGNGDISLEVRETAAGHEADEAQHGGQGLEFGPRFPWDLAPSPARLVTPTPSAALAEATGLDAPAEVRHGGRDGWAVTLGVPSLTHPLRLVVDARAGIVLMAEVTGLGYREELTEVEFPGAVPDSRFRWSDDLAVEDAARHRRRDLTAAHYRSEPLPLPGFWPGGRDHFTPDVFDGDLGTGLLAIDLYTDGAPAGTPSMAVLIRQPPHTPPYEPGWVADPETFVHRWRDGTWQWTLALWGRPLTPEELARVTGSIAAS